jgi:hypothetical protein
MRRILACGLVVAALAVLAGCGGPLKYNIQSSRLAPGADAEIIADVNESANQTAMEVHVKDLPPPERVNPNAKLYVAWWRKTQKGTWARVGNVTYNPDARTGEMIGTIPEKEFDFEISAEADEGAQSPSADVVFSQHVEK